MRYAFSGNEGFHAAMAERLAAAGFERCEDAGVADVVLTFCVSQTELEDAYFDEDGFVQSVRPGTLLVDLSASTPGFSRELGAVAAVSDLPYVEAPLAVRDIASPDALAWENLSVYAAGEDADIDRALPLLNSIAADMSRTGALGTAQLLRAARSLQVASQVTAAIEAEALAQALRRTALGSELGKARPEAFSDTARFILDALRSGRFEGAYTVEMLMAELSSALMAADDADLILPQAEASMHLLELLAVIGGAEKSPATLSLIYGEEAACAEHGLDWSRAEEAFGLSASDGDADDDFDYGYDDECGCGGHHGGGFDYSSN